MAPRSKPRVKHRSSINSKGLKHKGGAAGVAQRVAKQSTLAHIAPIYRSNSDGGLKPVWFVFRQCLTLYIPPFKTIAISSNKTINAPIKKHTHKGDTRKSVCDYVNNTRGKGMEKWSPHRSTCSMPCRKSTLETQPHQQATVWTEDESGPVFPGVFPEIECVLKGKLTRECQCCVLSGRRARKGLEEG